MDRAHTIPPFVDWDWCRGRAEGIVLVDSRWYLDGRSGWEAYRRGHLPGAVFIDLDRWLSGPASPGSGRHPLPDPATFEEGMRNAGINNADTVVVYDDAGGVIAARLVWMLRATGHAAAILDGGMAAYPGTCETDLPDRLPGDFLAKPWPPGLLADIMETCGGGSVVVDARNRDRFEGKQDPVDPRPGHIPDAVNVPCRANLDPAGQLLPVQELRKNFALAGITSAEGTISYCGSGVTACHNLLVMEHLGLGRGRLFVGGWSQYGLASHLPVEVGA